MPLVGVPATEVVGAVHGIEVPVEVDRGDLADPPRGQQLADLPRGRREAVVERHVDPPPGPRLGVEDAPAVLGRRRHRLLGDDVDARLERLHDDVGMGVVAGADDERVRPARRRASRRGRSSPPAPSSRASPPPPPAASGLLSLRPTSATCSPQVSGTSRPQVPAPRCPVPTMASRLLLVCTGSPIAKEVTARLLCAGPRRLSRRRHGPEAADMKASAEAIAELPAARRPRDPERTKRDILIAAREEFVEHGLDGARVDRIAERAGANKRMLYHYVGNKEALYARVLLDAYARHPRRRGRTPPRHARPGRRDGAPRRLHLRPLPAEPLVHPAARHREHPARRLRARVAGHPRGCTRRSSPRSATCSPPARPAGIFRPGVDPVQLYITIAGISYFYMSNIHTLSVIFDAPLAAEANMAARRQHAIDVVLGYLRPANPLAMK